MKQNELIEKLAQYIHDEQWSGWMKYMFEKCVDKTGGYDAVERELIYTATIPTWACERWSRQMDTSFRMLPEEEKKSDIVEAENIIKFLKSQGYTISER